MEETTDLQKLQAILDSYKVSNPHISFEDIVGLYLRFNGKDFNVLRLSSFLFNLNGQYLQKKIYNVWWNDMTKKVVYKLANFEDLEEELGCPLEVLIKPLLEGGIIENDGYGSQLNGLRINGDGSLSLTAVNGDHYDLKDYHKTWWLKGEKDD